MPNPERKRIVGHDRFVALPSAWVAGHGPARLTIEPSSLLFVLAMVESIYEEIGGLND